MPYTFVLAPPSNSYQKYVDAAQLFAPYQKGYLLTNDGSSSPHITLVQFCCELEKARKVWAALEEKMTLENFQPFPPSFTGVAFIEGIGPYEGTVWVELSANRDEPILRAHACALDVLSSFGLTPLNAHGNQYRPHLTLARIAMPKHIETWPKDLCQCPGSFNLALGESDENWQYKKMLAVYKIKGLSVS